MITFETQEEFEAAVMSVIADKLVSKVEAYGHPFMTGFSVALCNHDDRMHGGCITEHTDRVA